MFKHKIIYKDIKVRERLREEKGLQRQFTTYTFPESSESIQTLPQLENASAFSSGEDWCIVQEQNDWQMEEFGSSSPFYDVESGDCDQITLEPKNNRLKLINEEYFAKMAAFPPQQPSKNTKIKFQPVFKVKTFFQDSTPVQIYHNEERFQNVNFRL